MYELPVPDGYGDSHAELFGNSGHAAGWARDSQGELRHIRWNPDGSSVALVGLGGNWDMLKAVNDDGIVAGVSSTSDTVSHAVTWDASGVPKRLREPEGYLASNAEDINNAHVAVGFASIDNTAWAVRWERDGAPAFLEKLPHSSGSSASRINDNGEVIGKAWFRGGTEVAVRWDAAGKAMNLGIKGQAAVAADINNRGTVAGQAFDLASEKHYAARALRCCVFRAMDGPSENGWLFDVNNRDVFLGSATVDGRPENVRWDGNGLVVLRPVPGTTESTVTSLNDTGLSVGSSGRRAAIWDASGQGTHLPDEKPGDITTSSHALLINNAGQILGDRNTMNGPRRAVVWR
ncbi:hypothetical protein CD790_30210 [Streptomyces sp. SAJ15]|nr:hypothetical protein CD790_30210 [Streptomyces sp. SAJ15]